MEDGCIPSEIVVMGPSAAGVFIGPVLEGLECEDGEIKIVMSPPALVAVHGPQSGLVPLEPRLGRPCLHARQLNQRGCPWELTVSLTRGAGPAAASGENWT